MIVEHTANAVIVPANAQVGQLSQLWLFKQGIISEEGKGLFTPVAVQAADADVELLLLPNRLQIGVRRATYAEALPMAAERAQVLLQAAGDTVIGALAGVGLNVQVWWNLKGFASPDNLLESKFFKDGVLDHFTKDRQMGLSVIEQIDGVKITSKLDHARNVHSGEPGLALDINVHVDVVDIPSASAFLARTPEFVEAVSKRVDQIDSEVLGGR